MFNSTDVFAAGGLIFVLIYVVLFVIGIWISYSVIWRAVRRGMKEFHKDNPTTPTS
jgi:hypothetical protein